MNNTNEYIVESDTFSNPTSQVVSSSIYSNIDNFELNSFTYLPKDTVKVVSTKFDLPSKATSGAAAYDIRSVQSVTIEPNQTAMIGTGLYLDIPDSIFGMLVPRSGLSTKHGVTLANSIGIIDSDFTGEVKISLKNSGNVAFTVNEGDRVAQLIFMTHLSPDLVSVKTLTKETSRNPDGFGTTGVK